MAMRRQDEIVEICGGGMKISHAACEKHPPRSCGLRVLTPRVVALMQVRHSAGTAIDFQGRFNVVQTSI
jgi:hypothetical protein